MSSACSENNKILPKYFETCTAPHSEFSPVAAKSQHAFPQSQNPFPRSLLTPSITQHQQDVYFPTPCCWLCRGWFNEQTEIDFAGFDASPRWGRPRGAHRSERLLFTGPADAPTKMVTWWVGRGESPRAVWLQRSPVCAGNHTSSCVAAPICIWLSAQRDVQDGTWENWKI